MSSIARSGPWIALGLVLLAPGALPRPAAAQDAPRVVRRLAFEGNAAIDEEVLRSVIGTTNSSWFATNGLVRWIGLGEKRLFNEIEFERDVLRLTLLYRKSGYPDVAVDTVIRRTPTDVYATFRIREGAPIRVTSLAVSGLDGRPDRDRLLQDLPIEVGDPFNRFLLQVAADTVVRRLRDRGHPGAAAYQSFTVDRVARTARIELEVDPGPAATIGAVRVIGTRKVDSSLVRSVLATRTGQPFSEEDIFRSQRNLYRTSLFRYASVRVDSASFEPGTGSVPLLVQVNEGRFRRIRSSVGFGTNDCFRAGLGWTARNWTGGGKILDLSARVSKIGVGSPFDFDLEQRFLCRALEDDTVGSFQANYNLTASLRRPAFLSPHNTGTLALFAERRSEFRVYRREEVGGSLTLARETAQRIPLVFAYRLSFGRTEADPATFCAFLEACTTRDVGFLRERQRLATLAATVTLPRANNPLDPTRGYVATAELTHSSRFIGSSASQQFTRVVGDMAWYRPLGRSVVLAWRVRGGLIVAPRFAFESDALNFIPPEQRFYGGGPNDVRGYDRNELGPLVYVVRDDGFPLDSLGDRDPIGDVRFSATGGNTVVVGNVELRLPSPIFPSRMRWAVFLDGGSVWERGEAGSAPALFRVTPGAGIRIATPLGPARLDVAYNPYDRQPGTLYLARQGELFRVRDGFTEPRPRDFTVHFSVGQAF